MTVHFRADVLESALDRLDNYTDQNPLRDIMKPLLRQVADLDEAIVDAKLGRTLDTATGFAKEQYMKIIQLEATDVPKSLLDEFIKSKIKANNSDSTFNAQIETFKKIAGETDFKVKLFTHWPDGQHLTAVRSDNLRDEVLDDIYQIMELAKDGGKDAFYSETSPDAFRLDDGERGLGSPLATRLIQ